MLTMDTGEARNQPGINAQLRSFLRDDFDTGHLYSGDYAALDLPLALGIERKAFSNLVSSLISGELDEQLARLVEVYDVPVLLVENMPSPYPDGTVPVYGAKKNINYAWIIGSVVGWYKRGVMPLFIANQKGTAATIAAVYTTLTKKEGRTYYAPKQLAPNLRAATLVERVLLQFPGVGEKRLAPLTKQSLVDLANQPEEFWIGAVGPAVGKKVYEAWRRIPPA